MGVLESMAGTAKGLRDAASGGGFFYLVTDAKGANAALVVLSEKKDADGKKTGRLGRSMLKDFKKEHGKGLFSEGRIESGSPVVFSITKGSAKPGIIKRAFKQSSLLHEGVGASVLGLLKGAKIRMSAPDTETSSATPDASATEAVDEAGLKAWAEQPEVQEMIEALGLSSEDLAEVFEAEQAFARYAESLPRPLEEETALQEQLAETEQLLDELALEAAEVARLQETDLEQALVLEDSLNQKRIQLAQRNATGPDPFASSELSAPDREALAAAVRAGMALLLQQVTALRAALSKLSTRLDGSADDPEAIAAITLKRNTLLQELGSIEQQFSALRTKSA
jgi:hypothetical protein